MKLLLIGGGGREHALAWKLAQSPSVERLWAAPGNPGIARHAELAQVSVGNQREVTGFCQEHGVDLVVIGPEQPLVDGLADTLRAAGIAVFGPGAKAAQLEGSKSFTKDLCAAAGIPTARSYRISNPDDQVLTAWKSGALEALEPEQRQLIGGPNWVIKADGLAAGKGVLVTDQGQEAITFADRLVAAGGEVIVEEFMEGEEVSLFALTDGTAVVPFGSAQDHKRVGDGDTGPNTGGMGAYSPAAVLTPALERRAMAEIVVPTVRAMAAAGTPFNGVLYAGLMLTAEGPKLVEYNVRFGDPECQVVMARFDGDLAELMMKVAGGRLAEAELPRFRDEAALTVVVAARGYPGEPATGGALAGIDAAQAEGAVVFQAGTAEQDGRLVASGGRVLSVTASAPTIAAAQHIAYQAAARIDFADGFYRRDIGWRALAREGATESQGGQEVLP